jgi:hypothetical protein
VSLTASVSGGTAPYKYQWIMYVSSNSSQDHPIAGATTSTLETSQTTPGKYIYFVVITDANGMTTASNQVTLTVTSTAPSPTPTPTPTPTATPPVTVALALGMVGWAVVIVVIVIVILLLIFLLWSRRSKKKIVASAGDNGTITPKGTVKINRGADQTFTITANPHYQISDVQVDGKSIGPKSSYTFTKVKENHKISATFKPE